MTELLCSNLPRRLVKARKVRGLSLEVLSGLCGLAASTVRLTELGAQASAVNTIERIASALGVSPAWLAYGLGKHDAEVADSSAGSGALLCGDLGHRLTQARKAAGLTLETLGKRCDISPSTVRRTEIGMHSPRVDIAELLAHALGVSPAWLAYGLGRRDRVVEVREPPPDARPLSASGLRPGRGRYFTIKK